MNLEQWKNRGRLGSMPISLDSTRDRTNRPCKLRPEHCFGAQIPMRPKQCRESTSLPQIRNWNPFQLKSRNAKNKYSSLPPSENRENSRQATITTLIGSFFAIRHYTCKCERINSEKFWIFEIKTHAIIVSLKYRCNTTELSSHGKTLFAPTSNAQLYVRRLVYLCVVFAPYVVFSIV